MRHKTLQLSRWESTHGLPQLVIAGVSPAGDAITSSGVVTAARIPGIFRFRADRSHIPCTVRAPVADSVVRFGPGAPTNHTPGE